MAKEDMPKGNKDCDWRTVYLCETLAQAEAVIHYCHAVQVNTSHDAMVVEDSQQYVPNRFHASLSVSKADGLKYVARLLDEHPVKTRDGVKLALKLYITERKETARWDRKKLENKPDRTVRVCWIG